MEDYNNSQEENRNRELDRPREYNVAPAGHYQYQEEETHLRDYLQVILRKKWIVITFFIAVVTTVTIGTFMMKPQYKSTVTIQIDKENPNILMFKDIYAVEGTDDAYYGTQYKILKSRNLARRVIRKLKLDSNPEFAVKREEVEAGSMLEQDKLLDENIIDSSLVDAFIGRIDVAPQQKSRLVNVEFSSYDSELSAKVANTIADSFISLNIESKFEATQQARDWIEKQLDVMKAKVERAEEKLNAYAARNEIIFLDKENSGGGGENIITARLAELSKALTRATTNRIQKEAIYKTISLDDPEYSSVVMGNSLIQSLKKEYVALDSEYNKNLKIYKPDYPRMIRMRELQDQTKKKLDAEIKRVVLTIKKDYETALQREKNLTLVFNRQKQRALDLNTRSIQYQILKREADTNKELYKGLLQRLKETGISASLATSNIQILDRAEVPKSPYKPRKTLNVFLSLIVGLFGGIGLAFFAEYIDNTIKTPEDVEKKIYMPSLGLVPLYSGDNDKVPVEYISFSDTKNPLSEAYSSLRTFLLFSTAGKPPKVMMVTSPRREEGKTTTAINTAISLTKPDAKVVLIDADMRRPKLHKVFKLSNKEGLSSFLSGNREFGGELIQHTDVPGLDIITSGPLPPNPAELLSSYRLRDLIEGLYPLYDFVLFDTPPLLGLADAAITSTQTDGVIMVVKSGSTPKEAAVQARKILESVNAKVLGVVLNAINDTNLKYGYYSYYQYYYQAYGGDEDK